MSIMISVVSIVATAISPGMSEACQCLQSLDLIKNNTCITTFYKFKLSLRTYIVLNVLVSRKKKKEREVKEG